MKSENLGFVPRRVFPHVEISSVGCFPAVLYVSMNMCVYGNEMCLYVAHERSLATRAGLVLSTLTQAPFQTFHSSEGGESV